ncbi:MAG TPA: hypothetical protein VGC41_23360, partial [Kofleriaceae bacterium]
SGAAWFRLAIAALLAALHLWAFAHAAHTRLHEDFNVAPDEAPYFSDPDAPMVRGYPRQPHRWSRMVVSRLDAQHYIGTSVRGLTACPKDPHAPDGKYLDCGLGWLPAWGTIGGIVSNVTGISDDKVLMYLSIIASFFLCFAWTSLPIVSRVGRDVAWATMIGFNAYPSGFYVVTPYTEAITIACAMVGFVFLCRKRWVWAAFFVGASTAFRLQAVAFAVGIGSALLVAAWQKRKAKEADWWKPLLGLPLAGWGQIATMLSLQIALGDWRAFLRARHAFGDAHNWGRLTDITYYVKGFAGQDMDVVFLVAFIAIIALTYKELVKKFDSVENTFLIVSSLVTIVLSVVAPLVYWGITRYLMLCPMAFFGIGVLWKQHRALFVVWVILCLAFYWHIELCGYIAQGNPQICPCLGKMEFTMPFGS